MPFEHVLRDPVLIILAVGSLVSWALIVDCTVGLWRSMRADARFLQGDRSVASPLSRLLSGNHDGSERENLLIELDTSVVLQRHRLEWDLPLLGAIGSTAPYLGLLGTVIGIIQAFQSIQAQNNMSPSVVAGGIATALIATAMGLAVAIPAVAAHHLLASAISRRVADWEAVVAKRLSSFDTPADRVRGHSGSTGEEAGRESLPLA